MAVIPGSGGGGTFRNDGSIVRIGLNYKFGGGGLVADQPLVPKLETHACPGLKDASNFLQVQSLERAIGMDPVTVHALKAGRVTSSKRGPTCWGDIKSPQMEVRSGPLPALPVLQTCMKSPS